MQWQRWTVGELATNCYLVWCENTRQAALIDPGGKGEQLLAALEDRELQLKALVNTHGHADHMAGNSYLQAATGAEILIHAADAPMLVEPARNLSLFLGQDIKSPPAGRLLHDGDGVAVGQEELQVRHTPGHTPGGISLVAEGLVFSGDTLFAGSVGRTDFPGGSREELLRSIESRLMVLPDETRVLPGHGPETTIGAERQSNPFLQSAQT